MKKIVWLDDAWTEYQDMIETDLKKVKKINALIKSIMQDGKDIGIGHPEPLRANLSGLYSRHIDKKHRLLYYTTDTDGEEVLVITSCKSHYGDK